MLSSSGTSFGHVSLAIHLFLPFLLIFCVYSNPKLLPAVALLWAEAICQSGQHECVCVCEKEPYCTSFHHGLCNGKGLQVTICQKVYRRTHNHNHYCLFLGAVLSLLIQVDLCKNLNWANRHISPLFLWGASCLLARGENMTTSSHMSTGLEKASQCKGVAGWVRCSSPVCAPSL